MLRDRWLFGRKTGTFTLQWHLTNACPFHCAHCYDRSQREIPSLNEANRILSDFLDFCRRSRVQPHLSLSGGDPLLYPHFHELYRAVSAAGVPTSILGNPISRAAIEGLLQIQAPTYYQVSLEGLQEQNDAIRGPGHFEKVMEFLANARSAGMETHVMLTLTRANADQVIPLGNLLRGLTARFTFNRLTQVGNGRLLQPADPASFAALLGEYFTARRENPILGFKDNLFNIVRHQHGRSLLPGCTGFGCGAAFNFVALLPDGEVHACRKYPSPIGHISRSSFYEIYHSSAARSHRRGPTACAGCPVKKSCGGCPAVSHGQGLVPLRDRDPYCFIHGPPMKASPGEYAHA